MRAQREFDATPGAYSHRDLVLVGRILGMLGTALFGLVLLLILYFFLTGAPKRLSATVTARGGLTFDVDDCHNEPKPIEVPWVTTTVGGAAPKLGGLAVGSANSVKSQAGVGEDRRRRPRVI